MLLKCIAEVRFGGVKKDISFEDIGLEELHRGMHDPVQAHRDYQVRHAEMLDFLRRVAFHPSLGCPNWMYVRPDGTCRNTQDVLRTHRDLHVR